MGSVKVFGLPASTDVARVLTCLFEKDVEFQFIRMDSYKNDHKVPEFIKLQNPHGHVTFEDGKRTFTDSREICRYVAEKYEEKGNKSLIGIGALERDSIEKWLKVEAQIFDPPSSDQLFHLAYEVPMGIDIDHARIEKNVNQLSKILDVYDQRLEESKYLAGDEFTLADLSHLPSMHYLKELFISRKNVLRWWGAIKARPSWMQVVHMQKEFPSPLTQFQARV